MPKDIEYKGHVIKPQFGGDHKVYKNGKHKKNLYSFSLKDAKEAIDFVAGVKNVEREEGPIQRKLKESTVVKLRSILHESMDSKKQEYDRLSKRHKELRKKYPNHSESEKKEYAKLDSRLDSLANEIGHEEHGD